MSENEIEKMISTCGELSKEQLKYVLRFLIYRHEDNQEVLERINFAIGKAIENV